MKIFRLEYAVILENRDKCVNDSVGVFNTLFLPTGRKLTVAEQAVACVVSNFPIQRALNQAVALLEISQKEDRIVR